MADAMLPVDPFNPGQVFASLGLVETSLALFGSGAGAFEWHGDGPVRFRLRVDGVADPLSAILDFFATARVFSVAPETSPHATDDWNVPTRRIDASHPFPFAHPGEPATLPAVLVASTPSGSKELWITYWGEPRAVTGRDNVKYWGGAGGYPGAALVRDALDLIRARRSTYIDDLFNVAAPQPSSFRFDWRRDYVPLDIGFSLNKHTAAMTTSGFPLVELLAAVGLTHARPERVTNLEYRYGILGASATPEVAPASLLYAALGACELPFPLRLFRMHLGWPGQEGQARCITKVVEEAIE